MSQQNMSTMDSARNWFAQNKLKTVGSLWLSAVAGSLAYNWSRPNMKTSVKIIHARMYAQAFTLAALGGVGLMEYLDKRGTEDKPNQHY